MKTTHEELQEIEELLRIVKPSEAESKFSLLVEKTDHANISLHLDFLKLVVSKFQPKRQIRLRRVLSAKMVSHIADPIYPREKLPRISSYQLHNFEQHLIDLLKELSDRHIFQWSTHYRQSIHQIWEEVTLLVRNTSDNDGVFNIIFKQVESHSKDIFSKGFDYLISGRRGDPSDAKIKSLNGLQRFLELPIEQYTAALISNENKDLQVVRRLNSALLCGILSGYGSASFGGQVGWHMLPRFTRTWAHYLAFLCGQDIVHLVGHIESGSFQSGLNDSVLAAVRSLDKLLEDADSRRYALPRFGQFSWDARRLDISLPLSSAGESKQFLEIQCYLDQAFLTRESLLEAANRGVDLVFAPLRVELKEWVAAHDLLRSAVLDTTSGGHESLEAIVSRAVILLKTGIARYTGQRGIGAPIQHNFARDFPLNNPYIQQQWRVQRLSVRRLLESSSGMSGIRLWCSVRRSGKTTSCFAIDSSREIPVIPQTCEQIEQHPGSSIFFQQFTAALDSRKRLPQNFFSDAVASCSNIPIDANTKVVFVLDEYETLFGEMRRALREDHDLRYLIVQPLLNQIVSFSRNNLVVFIGQQPDAHYILMDQNQLSPYVRQEAFPLFTHVSSDSISEFRDLLRKVLSPHVGFNNEFLECVYAETAGHPYLTVNLMVDFFDWLIKMKRPANDLFLSKEDYVVFASERLSGAALRQRSEYDLFRNIASEALGDNCRRHSPWLYSTYAVMRKIAEQEPDSLTVSLDEFDSIVKELKVDEQLGYDPADLLRSASSANFLAVDNNEVRPRIPLLARISCIVRPKIT